MTPTKQVTEWMTEVQTLKHDVIAKIDEDYDRQKACLPINCWSRYRISKRAVNAILESEELMRKQQKFEGVVVRSAPTVRMIPTPPEVTRSSTEMYLSKAIPYVQDDDVGMVGIWGMGGVGKTTLLQKINNHPFVADARFDYVIWLTASKDLNLDMLQKEIADRVGFKHDDAGSRAQALYHFLEKKKFLLLLDDVWEPFDLTKAGIPHLRPCDGAINKHKVVFTTRFESVSDQMMAYQQLGPVRYKKIKIECLRPEEAWELFLSNVGECMRSINSDQRVGKRAKKVADKCGGLPLALVVIARTMSANQTWQEWEEAVNLINTNMIQEMWKKGDDPFPLLKINYDRLQDDVTRKCFLCCVLWPEDHEIKVHDLIDCWLGMGIIDYHGDIGATYRRGYTIVERLKRACLLERFDAFSGDAVKMHDIIRGMVLWIISLNQGKWMVGSRANLKDGSEDEMQWHDAETISLLYGRSGILPQRPDCPKLLSLMLSRNHRFKVIPEGFFQNMPALTFLNLSSCWIKKIPPAIGGLLQLRHLNLSDNPIGSLPLELENLGGLKVLLLNDLHHGLVYPNLSKFQKLGHLGVQHRAYGFDKPEEQTLIEEVAQSKITSLDITVRRLEIVEQLVAKNPPVSFRRLEIRRLEGVTTLQLPLPLLRIGKTSSILSHLRIRQCDELEDIWISNHGEEEFDNLERFVLFDLPALRKMGTLSGSMSRSLPLRNVRFMSIKFCRRLKSATWILQHCPYLESLEIGDCKEMRHVIGKDEDRSTGYDGDEEIKQGGAAGAAATTERSEGRMEEQQEGNPMVLFPHLLTSLRLRDLPKLRAFSTAARAIAFPSLKIVHIFGCPLLDEAPFSHLKIHRGY